MGLQFDIVIPPIIAGIIILILFRLNSFMMHTSVDQRLGMQMQNFAEVIADLIEVRVREAASIQSETCKLASCRFTDVENNTVRIYQNGSDLIIEDATGSQSHAARLDTIKFLFDGTFLKFELTTQSRASEEVGADDGQRVKGFSTRRVFLRNIKYN